MYEAFKFYPSRTYGRSAVDTAAPDPQLFTATQTSALRRLGQELSEPSLIAKYMALDPMVQDAFQERAAILENDAGLTRLQAELEAFRMVMYTIAQGA